MSQYVNLDASKFIDPITDVYPVFLLEISHDDYGTEPLRVCSSNVQRLSDDEQGQPRYGAVSNGVEYLYVPMGLSMPTIAEDGAPTASLQLFRTDELTKLHRSIQTRPSVNMVQVWSDDLDTVAAQYPGFKILDFELSQATISDNLGTDMDDTSPFPSAVFSNVLFGGVHR